MNLLDAIVIEVLGPPTEYNGWFFVPVKYDCWGRDSTGSVMVKTLEEANKVKVGYVFQT